MIYSAGNYTFKGANGKFWVVKSDGAIQCNGAAGDVFHLEWLAHTKFAIRAASTGQYVKASQQGGFQANSARAGSPDTLFEY